MTESDCPVDGAHELHEDMKERSAEWNTAINGLGALAFYAVPDFIDSKALRFLAKSGIAAGILGNLYHQEPEVYRNMHKTFIHSDRDMSDPWEDEVDIDPEAVRRDQLQNLGVIGALVAVLLTGVVVVEKLLYHRAEHKASKGHKLPHTRQAVGVGVVAAAITYLTEKFLQK